MEDVVRDLGVLSEPARVRLLAVLQDEELGVAELVRVLQLPQSTVSRHLKALRTAGWVRRRAVGTTALHGAALDELEDVGRRLWEVVHDAFAPTLLAREDQARLAAALAEREGEDTFFGRMHAEWDALRRDLFGDEFMTAALTALVPSDWVVADLGCGTGPALVALAPAVRRVIGVDREPRMLAAAADRTRPFDNVELRKGGLTELPLAAQEIDAATCLLVLHHVEPLAAAFAEVARALRPGGRFVVVDMIAHERRDWTRTMGHRHLGFERDALAEVAARGGLTLRAFRRLPPVATAQGPPLFVAAFDRSPVG